MTGYQPTITRSSQRRLAGDTRLCRVVLLTLVLAGCVGTPRRDATLWRPVDGVDPAGATSFRVAGRLAVSDGRDGGSAGFVWSQWGDRFEFELRQPVSQKTWRLTGNVRGALLEGGDDGPRRAVSAEELLRDVLGWHVPVEALRDWVRGVPHGGASSLAEVDRDGEGRLRRFHQDGWTVEYTSWRDGGEWPERIRAQQPPYSVRLNIQDWAVARD